MSPTVSDGAANAEAIVSWAEAQVGKPYIWGGVGPAGFDCSGLTSQAYLHGGGITIPRVAAAQQAAGVKIPAAEIQPADLCFIGIPAFHVVMYAGGGSVVAADETGVPVRIRAFDPTEFTGGFRRMATLTDGGSSNPLSNILSSTPLSGPLQALEGVNAVASHLISVAWWERVGKMALAILVIAIGLVFLNRKKIEQAAKTTAKGVAVAA